MEERILMNPEETHMTGPDADMLEKICERMDGNEKKLSDINKQMTKESNNGTEPPESFFKRLWAVFR